MCRFCLFLGDGFQALDSRRLPVRGSSGIQNRWPYKWQNQKSATLQILKAYQLQPCVPGAGGYLFEELVGVHVKPQWGPWIASLFLVGLCSVAEMLVLLYDLCREWNIISLSRCFKVAASNRTIRTGLPSRLPGRDRTKHNVKWCQHSTSCNKVSKHC